MQTRNKIAVAVFVVIAVVGAMVSLPVAQSSKSAKGWVAVAWTLGPPIWYWFEYTIITTEAQKSDKDYRDRLRIAQDVTSKVWAAFAGVFAASYFEALA